MTVSAALLAVVIGQGAAAEPGLPPPPPPPAAAEIPAGGLSLLPPRAGPTIADAPTSSFGSFAAAMTGVLAGMIVTATAVNTAGRLSIVPADPLRGIRYGGGVALAVVSGNIGDYMNGDDQRFLRRLALKGTLLAMGALVSASATILEPTRSGGLSALAMLTELGVTIGLFIWSFIDAVQCKNAPARWLERATAAPTRRVK